MIGMYAPDLLAFGRQGFLLKQTRERPLRIIITASRTAEKETKRSAIFPRANLARIGISLVSIPFIEAPQMQNAQGARVNPFNAKHETMQDEMFLANL